MESKVIVVALVFILIIAIGIIYVGYSTFFKPVISTSTSTSTTTETSEVNQEILSSLMLSLNSHPSQYTGSYMETHEVHLWGGHSGAADYTEKSNISTVVSDDQVINYTRSHIQEGGVPTIGVNENYIEFYNKTLNEICRKEVTSQSNCNAVQLSPPVFGNTLVGCKRTFGPNGNVLCICSNGNLSPDTIPGFPCSEETSTGNMELRYGHAVYYPETKKGFCYYEAVDTKTNQLWAFQCSNQNIILTPLVNTQVSLSNVSCNRYGYDSCICNFNPVEITNCNNEVPINHDSEIKNEIIIFFEKY